MRTSTNRRLFGWIGWFIPRFAFLRQYAEGRELSRSLRESLLMDDEGWVVRPNPDSSSTIVDYVEGGDKDQIRFTIKLLPGRGACYCRSCQTVQVRVNGAVVWLPPLARLLLKNVVRLSVLRYANKVADKSLGN